MSRCDLKFSYDTLPELEDKMVRFLTRNGYRVERAVAPMITVGQCAALVGRQVGSVSRSLRKATCPPFEAYRGAGAQRRRILKLRPTPELVAWLKERRCNYDPTL